MRRKALFILTSAGLLFSLACSSGAPGSEADEAMRAGLVASDLRGSASDYLQAMDGGLGPDEVAAALPWLEPGAAWESYNRGRNNWVVWTAGNDTLWNTLAYRTFGGFDLLKTISSHEKILYCGNSKPIWGYGAEGQPLYYAPADAPDAPPPYPPGYYAYDHTQADIDNDTCTGPYKKWFLVSRENRWKYLGLNNEPCYRQATGPRADRFELWLDEWVGGPGCPERDPFEDEREYPGVEIGARGKNLPVGSYYGYGTGVVGLRLFPNPDFDAAAEKDWDAARYYTDPSYYNNKKLVRPYRVGMSCAFCHVGPSPVNPPADPENPQWGNLASNPGAQYLWMDRIFAWDPTDRAQNFVYQLVHTYPPGTVDTSLVSSDNINNTRTMNAVYSIGARLAMAKYHPEKLKNGSLDNRQFNDYERTQILSEYFDPPDRVLTPHVLKDGADAVGILGALNRVYLNIGLFSEEWLKHFTPLLGSAPGKRITPIEIAVLQAKSTYWNANLAQTPDLALFFAASARPDYLERALERAGLPRDRYMTEDEEQVTRGRTVFAENCARCHSGKQPPRWEPGMDPEGTFCELGHECRPGQILENSAEYFEWMRAEVLKPDYLENNFLSTERRIPVTELGTNACSPLATNAIAGDIWDNFSSQTYKELPAVGKVTVHHPVTGEPWEYEMPGGGRGYTRPASLISVWSSAPYLLNNSVGEFYGAGSVEARMASFADAIGKMLWPERRKHDALLGDRVPGYIQRTTATSYLKIPYGFLPDRLAELMDPLQRWFPVFFDEPGVVLGPIPKGTPVALIASMPFVSQGTSSEERLAHFKKVVHFLRRAIHDLKEVEHMNLPPDEVDRAAWRKLGNLVDPMVELSKCPDYVVNRGHYFGSNLVDADKLALIEFLKTF
jgi:hypothetical protein